MLLTLLAAVLVGLVFEAEGLKIWAERLELGALRTVALPAAQSWHDMVRGLGVEAPRRALLALKEDWAATVAGASSVAAEAPPSEASAPVPLALVVPSPFLSAPSVEAAPVRSPALPAGAEPLQGLPPGQVLRIALAGDSMMAVGLAPTLRRGLGGVEVIKAYRSGTGLARPEVFDWLQQYPQMLGAQRPAIVICALGANDGQNVQVGKQVLTFGSPEWDDFYRSRLTAYLDLLTRDGTRVLWLGMPVMRAPAFARKMQHMNALVQDVLKAYPTVSWMDPNPLLSQAQGGFAQFRADARGKQIKLRADDGIHMTDEGALFLLPGIRAWLEQQLAQTVQAGTPAAARAL